MESESIVSKVPKISVIIPCFNAEEFLPQCLESVFSQTHPNLEVIVVDDCSTDGSTKILKQFEEKHSNLKVILQPKHKNAGACRNVGIKHATGDYVHFLDADDWIDSTAYETVLKSMGSKNVDACVFQFKYHDNQTGKQTDMVNVMTNQKQIVSLKQYPNFLIYSPVVPWNKLIKKSVIDDNQLTFDEIQCANDRSFYFKLIKSAKNILIIPDKLAFYRINNSGSLIGSGRAKNFNCNFQAFESSISAYANMKPKFKQILVDAYIRDFFYFFQKLPKETQNEVGKSLTKFFCTHQEISTKNEALLEIVEEVKNGNHDKINNFKQQTSHSHFEIFKDGFVSGLKLLTLKIKDKLSKGDKHE